MAVVAASKRRSNWFLFFCNCLSIIFLSWPQFGLSQSTPDLSFALQQCDSLYSQRAADSNKPREAAACYEQLFAKRPDADVAVRLGKTYYWIGAHAAQDTRLELFQKGIDWSNKAIQLDPKNPGGYFWLGVNNGKYGETRGIIKSLFLIGPIKDAMNQVIALDPDYEYGGAHRVLGRMYFKLPRFAGGGIDKSIDYLKKSLAFAPNISTTRLFLAECYLSQKDYKKAQHELNAILSTPPIPGLEPEFAADKEEARRLLNEVNKKIH